MEDVRVRMLYAATFTEVNVVPRAGCPIEVEVIVSLGLLLIHGTDEELLTDNIGYE
jgi:hypothetical protein